MFGQLQETQCLYGVSAGPRPGTSAAQGMARAYASATGRKFSASALQGTKLWQGRGVEFGGRVSVCGGMCGGGRGEGEERERATDAELRAHCWAFIMRLSVAGQRVSFCTERTSALAETPARGCGAGRDRLCSFPPLPPLSAFTRPPTTVAVERTLKRQRCGEGGE